jgi:hypothetical protein
MDCLPGQHLVSVRVASPALALVLFLFALKTNFVLLLNTHNINLFI